MYVIWVDFANFECWELLVEFKCCYHYCFNINGILRAFFDGFLRNRKKLTFFEKNFGRKLVFLKNSSIGMVPFTKSCLFIGHICRSNCGLELKKCLTHGSECGECRYNFFRSSTPLNWFVWHIWQMSTKPSISHK